MFQLEKDSHENDGKYGGYPSTHGDSIPLDQRPNLLGSRSNPICDDLVTEDSPQNQKQLRFYQSGSHVKHKAVLQSVLVFPQVVPLPPFVHEKSCRWPWYYAVQKAVVIRYDIWILMLIEYFFYFPAFLCLNNKNERKPLKSLENIHKFKPFKC